MITADLILSQEHGRALNRLKGISGFVTTLTRDGDERASVFNRLAHVERILLVSRMLCRLGGMESAVSDRVVLLHDLNRWVFAHNAEQGLYSQEDGLGAYLSRVLPGLGAAETEELRCLHRRELAGMRPAARPALAADMFTGIVEDPILLFSGLNVHPEALSRGISELLFAELPELGVRRLRELCALLHADRRPEAFCAAFSGFFTERAEALLRRYAARADGFDAMLELIARDYRQLRKTEAQRIFRINNELICHGSEIRALIGRLTERMGYPALCELLLTLDEPGFVARLRGEGWTERELEPLYPELDYTGRPDSAVRCLLKLR